MHPLRRSAAILILVTLGATRPTLAGSATVSFTLDWTAPGDDGAVGHAQAYDEAGNWSAISNVATLLPGTAGVDDRAAGFYFSNPSPNPARAPLRFDFVLPRAARIEVDAFDVGGRHVRRIASGWRAAGRGELGWDLRDEAGRRVPAGVYPIRARLGVDTSWRRVVVVP